MDHRTATTPGNSGSLHARVILKAAGVTNPETDAAVGVSIALSQSASRRTSIDGAVALEEHDLVDCRSGNSLYEGANSVG